MPVRLDGNINGTKQGALLWFSLLETVLIDFGFTPSKVEPCLFIKTTDGIIVYALVYVDDILIVSNRHEEITKLQDHFLVHFKRITVQKEVKKFLGIQLFPQYRDDGSKYVTLAQQITSTRSLVLSARRPVKPRFQSQSMVSKRREIQCKNT
jgi:hypothetical protein